MTEILIEMNRTAEVFTHRRNGYAAHDGLGRVRLLPLPNGVALQIRAGKHYAHAPLDLAQVDLLIRALAQLRVEVGGPSV